MITPDSMFCRWCEYIAPDGESYAVDDIADDPDDEDELDCAICPRCGESNSGGYQSFVPVWAVARQDWSDELKELFPEVNHE